MKAVGLGLFMLFLGACSSPNKAGQKEFESLETVARSEPARHLAGVDANEEYRAVLDSSPTKSATCREFFGLLRRASRKPTTIQAALSLLKASKPEYFSHYALVPLSLSLHQSDFKNPRVLVYGGDARMIVSFNGSPAQRSFERLEVMCFDDAKARFQFREITFPREAPSKPDDLTAAEAAQPFVISKANGQSAQSDCRMCHAPAGTRLRPNWDTYKRWPSNYGAIDDLVFRSFDLPADTLNGAYTKIERDRLATFVLGGRYSILNKNADERPNLQLGELLGRLNGMSIVGDLKRLGPAFEMKKRAFARAIYCPIDPNQLVWSKLKQPPDPNLKRILQANADYVKNTELRLLETMGLKQWIFKDGAKAQRDQDRAEYAKLGIADGEFVFDIEESIRLSQVDAIMRPLGVDIQNWSMVVNGGYLHQDGNGINAIGTTFEQILDQPFLSTFFPGDEVLKSLVAARRNMGAEGISKQEITYVAQQQAICNHLAEPTM